MKNFNKKEVQSSNNTPQIQESLYWIACRLDELTGNGMSYSDLRVTSQYEEDIADGIQKTSNELSELNQKIDTLSSKLEDIEFNLRSLSSISESLENIMMVYVESQKSK